MLLGGRVVVYARARPRLCMHACSAQEMKHYEKDHNTMVHVQHPIQKTMKSLCWTKNSLRHPRCTGTGTSERYMWGSVLDPVRVCGPCVCVCVCVCVYPIRVSTGSVR